MTWRGHRSPRPRTPGSQPSIRPSDISVIGWSMGGGGVLAAIAGLPAGPAAPFRGRSPTIPCAGASARRGPSRFPSLMLLAGRDEVSSTPACQDLVKRLGERPADRGPRVPGRAPRLRRTRSAAAHPAVQRCADRPPPGVRRGRARRSATLPGPVGAPRPTAFPGASRSVRMTEGGCHRPTREGVHARAGRGPVRGPQAGRRRGRRGAGAWARTRCWSGGRRTASATATTT